MNQQRRQKKFTVLIDDPEATLYEQKQQIYITIPSFQAWKENKKRRTKKNLQELPIYCGLQNPIPNGYSRAGNPYECLKKGFGAGMYSVFSENEIEE